MYLPGQHTAAEVAQTEELNMGQIHILRRHFNLYYKMAAEAKCLPEAGWQVMGGTTRYYTGINNLFCNVVIGLPKGSWDEVIEQEIAFFTKHKQSFVWYLDEKANTHFKEKLKENGFRYVGLFQGVIGSLDASYVLPKLEDGVTIEQVQDEVTIDACVELLCHTFHVPKEYKKAMCGLPGLFHWAAKKEGRVISCLSTLVDGGVVSFWNGATYEQYRRRGLSTALRKLALNHAISNGCHTGASYLMAEALALGICKGLGYQPKWRFEVYKLESV